MDEYKTKAIKMTDEPSPRDTINVSLEKQAIYDKDYFLAQHDKESYNHH